VGGEYAIIVGVIALVCLVVLIVLGTGVSGQFQQGGEGAQQAPAPLQPAIPSETLSWPATIAECEDGGWRNFVQFDNEGECREYVDGLTE